MINSLKKIVYLTRKKVLGKISEDETYQLNRMLENKNITYEELKDICIENKKDAVSHTAILILLKDKKYMLLGLILVLCCIVVSKKYKE